MKTGFIKVHAYGYEARVHRIAVEHIVEFHNEGDGTSISMVHGDPIVVQEDAGEVEDRISAQRR